MKNISIKIVAFLILASTHYLVPAEYNLYRAPQYMSERDKGEEIEKRLAKANRLSIPEIQEQIKLAEDDLEKGKALLDENKKINLDRQTLTSAQMESGYAIEKIDRRIQFLKSEAAEEIKKEIDRFKNRDRSQFANEQMLDFTNRIQSERRDHEAKIEQIEKKRDKDIQEQQKEKETLTAKGEQTKLALKPQEAQLVERSRELIRKGIKNLQLRDLDLQVYNNVLKEKIAKQPKQQEQPAVQPQAALNKQQLLSKIYKNIEDKKIKDAEINADIANVVKQFGAQSLNVFVQATDRTLLQHVILLRPTITLTLLLNGANPNYVGLSKKSTPLILFMKALESMVSNYPARHAELKRWYTPVITAFVNAKADLTKTDEKGRTANDIAKAIGTDQNILDLLNPARAGAPALQPAQAKNPADTKELLNKLTDAVSTHDETLRFTEEDEKAGIERPAKIAQARQATNKLLPGITALLKTADVRATDADGYTALHLAVMTDSPEIVKAVLDAGGRGDIFTKNKEGKTPVELATALGYKDIQDLFGVRF